jgi:hypothetical protein
MWKSFFCFLCIQLGFSLSACLWTNLSAHANELRKRHPCHNIKMACEEAGYKKKGKNTKDPKHWVNCLTEIRAGKVIPGVAVLPTEVAACNARIDAKKPTSGPSVQ